MPIYHRRMPELPFKLPDGWGLREVSVNRGIDSITELTLSIIITPEGSQALANMFGAAISGPTRVDDVPRPPSRTVQQLADAMELLDAGRSEDDPA